MWHQMTKIILYVRDKRFGLCFWLKVEAAIARNVTRSAASTRPTGLSTAGDCGDGLGLFELQTNCVSLPRHWPTRWLSVGSGIVRVSKSWESFVSSTPRLWNVLDFSSAVACVNSKAISTYIRNSRDTVSRALIGGKVSQQTKTIRHIITKCRALDQLDIVGGFSNLKLSNALSIAPSLKTLIISAGSEITIDTVSQVLGHCRNLDRAEFHRLTCSKIIPVWSGDMSKLRSLTMTVYYDANGIHALPIRIIVSLLSPFMPNPWR